MRLRGTKVRPTCVRHFVCMSDDRPTRCSQQHPNKPRCTDYGYHGGILQPRMCTLVVAIDPCLPENGGLEILARSHTCGRYDMIWHVVS